MAIDVENFQYITPYVQQFWSCPFQVCCDQVNLFNLIHILTLHIIAYPQIYSYFNQSVIIHIFMLIIITYVCTKFFHYILDYARLNIPFLHHWSISGLRRNSYDFILAVECYHFRRYQKMAGLLFPIWFVHFQLFLLQIFISHFRPNK